MITTLFFDLDDTLLTNSMERFLPAYFQQLGEHFAGWPNADRLTPALLTATRAAVANTDPARTLLAVFSECFSETLGWPESEWQPHFAGFYATRYPALQALTQPVPAAQPLLAWAAAQGLDIAITTNPLFTRDAVEQRLAWAGLSGFDFALVTDLANSHFAKPRPEYYAEALAALGRRPEQALVVGNDWNNDILAAAAAGLRTFWITPAGESRLPPEPAAPLAWVEALPLGHGTLAEFDAWARRALLSVPEDSPPDGPAVNGAALPFLLTGSLAALHGTVADWPAAAWARRPAPGEWSLTEIVCHLRDVEREVNLPRLHAVVEQDNPFLAGADTDPWAIERNYAAQSGPQALADFSRSRQETIAYLRRQPAATWQRTARHAIFGPTLLVEIAGWMLDHDRLHLAQVHTTRATVAV
ncbi:MAG: DinB family protein [Anaerolineales bacterium]|nr:DinB family protein [Anaerolineales bacterium]